jgi:putative membrane protein
MENGPDSVSNIHKRWSLTRINFSSYKISLVISIISSLIIIIFFDYFYLTLNSIQLFVFTTIGISFLVFSYFLDLFLLRKTPVNKISKILHVSAFSNLLWLLILIFGYLAFIIFQKEIPPKAYLLEGMMLAIGLRIGIFNSVFGANLLQAIKTAVIQPIIFLFLIIPASIFIEFYFNVVAISFGLILIGLGIGWTILADRAGRPNLQSTFVLLQAFLSAWTENKVENIEQILLAKSKDELVDTHIIKFINKHHNLYWVLPNIHPGPFKDIGGSNLPYQIYNHFSQKAVVFHSASDHSLNIPSKSEVIKYLHSLSNTKNRLDYGSTCSIPIQIKNKKATATGIIFDNTPILILSFAPSGMEDIPEEICKELEAYSKNEGFKRLFIIDSHNAMGKKIGKSENEDLLIAGKKCLQILKHSPQYGFKIGLSNTNEIKNHPVFGEDIGKSGLSIILIDVNKDANNNSNNNKKSSNNNNQYVIGWADSNNMKRGLREYVLQRMEQKGIRMLEICSSDTHENSGFRTSEGYYPFGQITKFETIEDHYFNLIELAYKKLELYGYEILTVESTVKVMGKTQFMNYSNALDKAMDLTKKCLIITFGVILVMLIVTN